MRRSTGPRLRFLLMAIRNQQLDVMRWALDAKPEWSGRTGQRLDS